MTTERRESGSNNQTKITGKKNETAEVVSRFNTTNDKILTTSIGTDRQAEKLTQKRRTLEMGTGTRGGFLLEKTNANRSSMPSPLRKGQRQHRNDQR